MILRYIKELSKNSIYYGLGSGVRRFFAIFTAPIMTRIFTPEDYGVISLVSTTVAFAGMVITLGISAGIFRHYYELDDNERKRLLFSGLLSQTLIIGSLIAILLLFIDQISYAIFGSIEFIFILKLALIQLFVVELFEHFMTLLRYQKRAQLFLLISSIQLILNLFFLIFYVAYLKLGIPGVYYGIISANIIPLLVLAFIQHSFYSLSFDVKYVKECLAFSVPLIPGWFVNMYLARSNKFYLQSYHSLEQVGLFSISEKIAGIVVLFMTIFFLAWDPMSMELINKKHQHYLYDSIARIFLLCSSVLVLGITFFAKEVLIILATENYYSAYRYAGLIAFGTLTFYLSYFLGQGIIIARKTKYQSYARVLGAIIATIVYFQLIPTFGAYGATLGTIAGYSAASFAMAVMSERLFHIPYGYKRFALANIFTFAMIVSYLYTSTPEAELSIISIAIKFGLILLSTLILALILLKSSELNKIYAYSSAKLKMKR